MAKKTYGYGTLMNVLHSNRPSTMTGVTPRDSDKEMLIQVLQFSGCKLERDQLNIIRQFNFESLTRARRKLQEAGRFLPSPEVAKKRRLKSYEVEQTAPKETPEGLQRRIEEN